MSIFAGVYARRADQAIPAKLVDELRAAVSRHSDDADTKVQFSDDRVFIVKVDIGALGAPGELFDAERVAVVAGDPILQPSAGATPVDRLEGVRAIAQDLAAGQLEALQSCRGTYSAAVYEKSSQRLHLIADKLGVRPVYFWVLPDYIVFATALRILEALRSCKKSLKLQGVAEVACFGYPLSDRTPYENIFALYAGEVVTSDSLDIKRTRYWRWDDLPAPAASDLPAPERLYRLFIDAIGLRLHGQKVAAAFLSGGLDSRAIVAALRHFGTEVFTANFAAPGSQDQVFGQLAAEKLGAHYVPLPMRPLGEGDSHSKISTLEWITSAEYLSHSPQRPQVVWSGDGGSVGLGHVYLNPDIVATARAGDLQGATEKFMAYSTWKFSGKLLKRPLAKTLADLVDDGIRAELESLHPADPGRLFYLFLMLNDQRRHMAGHFENLDLSRIEFELPFFDADFVAGIFQEPIDPFLRHVFYIDWLKCFPPGVLEVPWQAYPNHVPCPLPKPDGLTYQWDKSAAAEEVKKRLATALGRAKNLLGEPVFSREFLSYQYMRLFMLLARWGKKDVSYLLIAPSVIYRYWSRTKAAGSEA